LEDFWLYKKHRRNVEYTSLNSKELIQIIDSKTLFKYCDSEDNSYNAMFDWSIIKPSFGFFFDFENNETIIKERLGNSELNNTSYIYIETLTNIPIIKTKTDYFIKNWLDFVSANTGMGSFCITEDFKLLMEFTDDYKYFLLSNFSI